MPEAAALQDKLAAVRLKTGDARGAVEALQAQVAIAATEEALVNLATVAFSAGDASTAARATDRLLADYPTAWRRRPGAAGRWRS